MRTAVIPGSFDPVTLGHIDLIRRAALMFDRVVAVAMINEDKQYSLMREQRLALLEQAVKDIPNAEADFWDGMLWEYVRDRGACVVVKGVRNDADLQFEIEMADYNRARGAETVLLTATPEYRNVSSTEVRHRLETGTSLSGLVSPEAERLLRKEWKRREIHGGNPD